MRNRIFFSLILFTFTVSAVVILGLATANNSKDGSSGFVELAESMEDLCQFHLKQIELAIDIYYLEHCRYPESIEDLSGCIGSDSWEGNPNGCEYSLEFEEGIPTPVCSKGHKIQKDSIEIYDVE